MEWKYVKELKDKTVIENIEKTSNILIPTDLKQIIVKYNGGRPEKNVFDTTCSKERVLKSLISYNKEDKENIYLYTEVFDKKLLPFAVTEFGDLICYNEKSNEIDLYLHEQDKCEKICDNILEFFDNLYIQ